MGIRRILSSIGSSITGWRVRVAVGLAGTLIAVLPTSAMAKSNGPLDRSFGENGSLSKIFATYRLGVSPVGVVPHGDGFRIWAGVGGDLGYFDYRADGSLDPAVAGRGFRLIEPKTAGGNELNIPRDVALQGKNEIVAGGIMRLHAEWHDRRDHQTLSRFRANGELDRTFGHQGTVVSPNLPHARRVAVDRHGRIFTLAQVPQRAQASSSRFRPAAIQVARYHPDGRLDLNFGRDGVVRRAARWGTRVGAITIDGQGRPLVAMLEGLTGTATGLAQRGLLIRLTESGRIDQAFGERGLAGLGDGYRHPVRLAVTANGRILVGALDGSRAHVFALDRLGRLDPSFGVNGDAIVEPEAHIDPSFDDLKGLVVLADGKIAISGRGKLRLFDPSGTPVSVPGKQLPGRGGGVLYGAPDGSLITAAMTSGSPTPGRLRADLTPDPDFQANAARQFELLTSMTGRFDAVVGLSDRGFLLTTLVGDGYLGTDQSWYRLRPNGRLDPGFGENGFSDVKVPGVGDLYEVVAVLPRPRGGVWVVGPDGRGSRVIKVGADGSLGTFELEGSGLGPLFGAISAPGGGMVAVGSATKRSGRGAWKSGFLVARYRSDGSPYRRFGRDGVVRSFFPEESLALVAATDREGRVTVAGGTCGDAANCWIPRGGRRVITVARYLGNGQLDRGFGRRGYIQVKSGTPARVKSMALLRGGRIAVSIDGICGAPCINRSGLLVLNRDGSLDRGFGRGGRRTLRLGRSFGVHRISRGRKGGLTLAGSLESCSGRPEFSLIRLDRRGRFDRSFGGGDGILDSGVRGGVSSWTDLVSRQKPGTLTLGGYSAVKGRYGGVETAYGMARFRLDGRDGRTSVRPCQG